MSLYKQPGSPAWHANISVPGIPRIRRSTGTEDRVAAQRIHDEWKAEAWKLKPAVKGRTWSAAVELWLDAEERSDSELYSLKKFGEHYPDRAIEECTAESFEKALAFCKTAGTWTRYRTMVTAIVNVARSKGWIEKAPVITTKKDKKKKPRMWLTRAQWVKLYAELPPHMQPMAEFAIETGLRQSNVLGLQWARVDLERKFVWVEAEDTKADAAIPVPLSTRAIEILRSKEREHSDKIKAVTDALEGVIEHPEFVFTFRGKPIKEIKTAFIAACIRAGVGRYVGRHYEGFTWHGLRHTWATWHVQNETPLDVLQKLGSWSDPRMVQNYAHHSPGHLARYADNAGRKENR